MKDEAFLNPNMAICPTELVIVLVIVFIMIECREILSAQPISCDLKYLLHISTLTMIVLLQLIMSPNDSRHRIILLMSSDLMIMRALNLRNQALNCFSYKVTFLIMATFCF